MAEPRLRDLFLVDCAARTEVVEQILYDSLLALAATVGAVPGPLEASRDEEADALRLLESARRELLRLL